MSEKIKCMMLQGALYMLFCLAFCFNTYYLGNAGFSDRAAGIMISASSLAGGFLQAATGRLADKHKFFIWKNQIKMLAAAETVLAVLLYFSKGGFISGAIFCCMMALALPMVPMANMASFYYSEHGVPVDYGMARGTGSIAFAVMSLITGRATVMWGSRMVALLAAVSAAGILTVALSMPLFDEPEDNTKAMTGEKGPDYSGAQAGASGQTDRRRGFIRKYPVFTAMIGGMFLFMFMHNVICTYMIRIVENVGGDSGSLGTALAIAAATELPMMFIYSRLVEVFRLSDAGFITLAGFFYVVRGILFMLAGSVGMVFFVQALQGLSYGLLAVARSNYANASVDAEDRSTGQSVAAMTESLGAVAGSLIGGIVLNASDVTMMLIVSSLAAVMGMSITLENTMKERKDGAGR